jgi:hypothetical protein
MSHATSRHAALVRCLVAGAMLMGMVGACGGTSPAVATPEPTPSATATTTPSAPPPSSASSAGANPDAAAALDAFRAFVQTEQAFHMAGDMLMKVSDLTLQAAIVSDVAKGDEQGTIDLRGPGVSVRLSIILVDGTVYLRLANRDWQKLPAGSGAFSNPLGGLAVEGLKPIDIVDVGGVKTQHLRVENPEGLNGQTLSGNTLNDLTVKSSSLDVYVTKDGVPLTAIVEFSGTGTFGGNSGPVSARIRYDFSKFGQEVTIVAPPVAAP